jgi:hypothetical protein
MRRRPCRSCSRPTPLGELVETHVYAGQTAKPGWWVSADRVIWLCRRCAPHRRPTRPQPREGR